MSLDTTENEELSTRLRQREGELVTLIEVMNRIEDNSDWLKLKSILLDSVCESIERKIRIESLKIPLDIPRIYQLQGELSWARKYSDLSKLVEDYRRELQHVRQKLKSNITS